ncbi:MAG TPA: glycosyltransferase family 4 protein, partial [Actinomycetota bacterium]|nr:glycosyltransferase family 4 protein [Actinomycetota bacterium]
HKIRARMAARRHDRSRRTWWGRWEPVVLARHAGSTMHARLDIRRWEKLQRRIASKVDAVTVCSTLDRERLGVRNAAVVANGYQATSSPLGKVEIGRPPTLLLAGALSYTPNADAARYFVRDIFPKIRDRIPDAQLRLVGRHDRRAEEMRGEGVTLTGYVHDIRAELAHADAVVVPIRFGGGTRIKVLEAFAHRIPVVSTSLGCEGLEVVGGRHVLISDDPDGFAADCIRLLTDRRLRGGLVAAASELFSDRYRWESISSTIGELAERVSEDRRQPPITRYGRASPNHSVSSGRISASDGAERSR